jgi:VWFA-related protein
MPEIRLLTRREVLTSAASLVAVGGVLRAQQQQPLPRPPNPTFSTNVEVVNVFVTVRDKEGRIVRDLSKEEFTVSEDGRPQNIGYFFREGDLPLTIGLLVDTTPSESNMLDAERSASLAFLTRMLRPEKDKAFLIQYHTQVDLLQGLTSSREELEEALDRLQSHGFANRGTGWGGSPPGGGGQQGSAGGRGPAPPGGGGPGGFENALSDAVYLASEEIMKSQQGRKALFILGDGDHLGDRGEAAIAAAERADTMIYAIRIADQRQNPNTGGIRLPGGVMIGGAPGGMGRGGGGGRGGGAGAGPGGPAGPGGDMAARGKDNLKKLAKQTGGAYFEVGKKETLGEIYGQIEEELRSQYNLGYAPDASPGSGYRTIKVAVRRKGMVVRGRAGYYPRARTG